MIHTCFGDSSTEDREDDCWTVSTREMRIPKRRTDGLGTERNMTRSLERRREGLV
jgi:hypothetical protein